MQYKYFVMLKAIKKIKKIITGSLTMVFDIIS